MRVETAAKEDRAFGVVPSAPWRVARVEALPDFRLRVRFVDGLEGVVDVKDLAFSRDAGVFSALRDPGLFSKVHVELGAVTWPGEIDLAPDAMYEEIKNHGDWRVPV
jgi:hypothetical protein